MFLRGPEEHRTDNLAHPELGDHQPGQSGCLLEVVRRAGAHLAIDQPFRRAAAHDRIQLGEDLALDCN